MTTRLRGCGSQDLFCSCTCGGRYIYIQTLVWGTGGLSWAMLHISVVSQGDRAWLMNESAQAGHSHLLPQELVLPAVSLCRGWGVRIEGPLRGVLMAKFEMSRSSRARSLISCSQVHFSTRSFKKKKKKKCKSCQVPYGWIKNKSMLASVLIHLVIALSTDMAENVPHMCEMKLVVRLTSVAYKSHFKTKRLCVGLKVVWYSRRT